MTEPRPNTGHSERNGAVNRPLRRRAFTLLEILLVTAIVSLIAAASVTLIGRMSPAQAELAAARAVHGSLLEARAMAMRRGAAVAVELQHSPKPGELSIRFAGVERTVPAAGLTPLDAAAEPAPLRRVTFDGAGRTHARVLAFANGQTTPRDVRATRLLDERRYRSWAPGVEGVGAFGQADIERGGSEPDAGRVWTIAFDPISGEATLFAAGDGAPAGLRPPTDADDHAPPTGATR